MGNDNECVVIQLENDSYYLVKNNKVFLMNKNEITSIIKFLKHETNLYNQERWTIYFPNVLYFYIFFSYFNPQKIHNDWSIQNCCVWYGEKWICFNKNNIDEFLFRCTHILSSSEYNLLYNIWKTWIKTYRWVKNISHNKYISTKQYIDSSLEKRKNIKRQSFTNTNKITIWNDVTLFSESTQVPWDNHSFWFAFSQKYSIANSKFFLQNNSLSFSAWFDFLSKRKAKKKCIAESIERLHSWSFDSDNESLWIISYDVANKIVWNKIFDKNVESSIIVNTLHANDVKEQRLRFPLDMVYYPFETTRYMATSSGVAAYFTIEGAIYRWLLELIERDAIMKWWLEKRSFSVIDNNSLPIFFQRILNDIASRKKGEVFILDTSVFSCIPTFLVLCFYKDWNKEKGSRVV